MDLARAVHHQVVRGRCDRGADPRLVLATAEGSTCAHERQQHGFQCATHGRGHDARSQPNGASKVPSRCRSGFPR